MRFGWFSGSQWKIRHDIPVFQHSPHIPVFDPVSGGWRVLNKNSRESLPNLSKVKVNLVRTRRDPRQKGSRVMPSAGPSTIAPKSAKRGLEVNSTLEDEAKRLKTEEEERRRVFERMLLQDDPVEDANTMKTVPVQESNAGNEISEERKGESCSDDDDDEDRLMIDTSFNSEDQSSRKVPVTEAVQRDSAEAEVICEDKERLLSVTEKFFQSRQMGLKEEEKCNNTDSKSESSSGYNTSSSATTADNDLDLDNDEVGLEMWKEILGIEDEGASANPESDDKVDRLSEKSKSPKVTDDESDDDVEVVQILECPVDETSNQDAEEGSDLEEGEIRSSDEEEDNDDDKKRPYYPPVPRSPKSKEEIKEKIYRKVAKGQTRQKTKR